MSRPLVSALTVALILVACATAPDAEMPADLIDEVESARTSLEQNEDGPIRSSFSFRALRCRADGGLLVVFEQASILRRSLAYAMHGPDAGADNWAGGFRVDDLETDFEIRHFFSEAPEVPCR